MNSTGKRKQITTVIGGMTAILLLVGAASCRAESSLPSVDAPLAPAVAGTRFAPVEYKIEADPTVALPPKSTGTHVTAVLRRASGAMVVAVWGDPVLWEKKGERYRPTPNLPPLSPDAAEVVALREERGKIIVGTRRAGEFVAQGGAWKPCPRPDAPYDADVQAMTAYRGDLFVATLNDGLVVRDAKGNWQHVAAPTISTDAPRQFVVWHDNLYVRHGNGVVDRFDGRTWTRDVFTKLVPRRQVSAMAVRDDTLLLAQWGGWSATTDGITVANHFPDDLNSLPITALLPQGDALYVGTQGRGLAEFDATTSNLRQWHDERAGIADDWITTLAPTPEGGVVAGTFVSGAFAREKNQPWHALTAAQNDCVTASVATPTAVFVALRRGGAVQRLENGGAVIISAQPEAQALAADEAHHLLWIGTRNGIYTASLP